MSRTGCFLIRHEILGRAMAGIGRDEEILCKRVHMGQGRREHQRGGENEFCGRDVELKNNRS